VNAVEKKYLDNISSQIYRQFPEVHGNKPKVQTYTNGQFLVIYQGKGIAANGTTKPSTVRVVVSSDGKIIKTTTSR